ncbi:beta-propeller domain-containing protein [Stackebrandtia nassauensis]|uniref:Secreted protein n=1 Tax=Stackebrandtia nassauensis (strain DSM 44728 / CIP 108903 / NRRL B-16338 / NBRC 102104 / LLR-40K-21) TaxID=446470 RepID=D3Q187_STANL|nr:beta-propeller domain-containing protein [Stackebrandtia nassauensis]ADD45667.1 Secreted protein [Stackebrandtia nassauensis DSM 44728]
MRPTEYPRRNIALATIGLCAIAFTAACTSSQGGGGTIEGDGGAPRLSGALTSFDSCDEALEELKAKAKADLEASGFGGYTTDEEARAEDGSGQDKAAGPSDSNSESGGDHSGTNVQEEGVDEPDIVKTDGERIVSLSQGRLWVVDAEDEDFSGSVKIAEAEEYGSGATLLLHGDRALVISPYSTQSIPEEWKKEDSYTPSATTLTLVDLSTSDPKVINDYTIEGSFVDARSVEEMSRVVISSNPRLPYQEPGLFEDSTDAREDAIDDSTIEDWLPRYSVGDKEKQVPCRSLARPTEYSGSATLTILSFDLTRKLDDGKPLSLEADGETVYGTADAIYIANNRTEFAAREDSQSSSDATELYRFGITGEKVKFESSEKVPGYLLNQYSMSEYDGHLRVATTKQPQWSQDGEVAKKSSSSVYTLKVGKDSLKRVGKVGGLGKDEQIKAVRFIKDTGYVVTFRQTDPLYTIDLSNPEKPKKTGELKIPGYSAYLHPVSNDRLIGVGKSGTDDGTITGTQVSLFDVSDPSDPTQMDTYDIDADISEVEYDPHAFLYWEDEELVVVPVASYDGGGNSMLALKIGEEKLSKVGSIEHEATRSYAPVGRSIVIGTALWTISDAGLMASDLDSLEEREWLPYN